jgi:hypothetical protein
MQNYWVIEQEAVLDAWFLVVDCLDYSLTLKMKEICSSETSVKFYRSIQCHIPENSIFQNWII